MAILEEFQKIAAENTGTIEEKDGVYTLKYIVAERKAFLSKKTLEYIAKFRIVEEEKKVKFTEMLKESGMGISSGGGGNDFDMSPGFGFKAGSYKVGGSGEREGTIEEQSNLFGKTYEYKFDFAKIRKEFEAKAQEGGYQFAYQITSIGL